MVIFLNDIHGSSVSTEDTNGDNEGYCGYGFDDKLLRRFFMLTTQLEVEALNAFTWKSKCPLALEKPRKLSNHQLKSTRFEILNGVAPCSSSRRNEARACLVEFATSCIFLTSSCLSALSLSLSLSLSLVCVTFSHFLNNWLCVTRK